MGLLDRYRSPERIALLHGEYRDDPNAFASTLTFTSEGAATVVEMRTVFPTRELREEAAERYHAVEGAQQTLSNLAAYVTGVHRGEGKNGVPGATPEDPAQESRSPEPSAAHLGSGSPDPTAGRINDHTPRQGA